MGYRSRKKIPRELQEGTIEKISHDGRGITYLEGKTVFIRDALPGELIHYQLTEVHSKYAVGQTVNVIQPSIHRVQPKCQHTTLCAGCHLQHADHATQIDIKQTTLLNHLNHVGHVQPEILLPPLLGPIWNYRRKARLSVHYVSAKKRVVVGFHEKNGRFVADLSNCQILHPYVSQMMPPLSKLIETLDCYKNIPQVEIAIGDNNKTALVFRHCQPLSESDIQSIINFAKEYAIELYCQPSSISSIHKLWPSDEQDYLIYSLPSHQISFKFHPTDFIQVNAELNQKMVNYAIELLELQKEDTVLDLFCGIGNFTLPIAKYCHSVTGIEGDEHMVKKAKENAAYNQLKNVEFSHQDLAIPGSLKNFLQEKKFDKILLDPPRCGAANVIESISHFKSAKKILYISCDPATLARDAHILANQHYTLSKAGIIDMFPHTKHVESIALFERIIL